VTVYENCPVSNVP